MQENNGDKDERVMYYDIDLIPFMAKQKEKKDRREISHQTGKLTASRAEAAVMQQPYRDLPLPISHPHHTAANLC